MTTRVERLRDAITAYGNIIADEVNLGPSSSNGLANIAAHFAACLNILIDVETERDLATDMYRTASRNFAPLQAERDKLAAEVAQLRIELEKEQHRASMADVGHNEMLKWATEFKSERDAALAKLARYEAPGPALLKIGDVQRAIQEHPDYDGKELALLVGCVVGEQQHARCVAVVEAARLPEEHTEECDAYSERVGRRKCINALCDGEVRAEAAEKQLAACLAALKDGAK